MAVLSPDISFNTLTDINTLARDNRGTDDETDDLLAIDTYPFYNKITIPYDNQWETSIGSDSIIDVLRDTMPDGINFTLGFLVTLELLIIKEFKLGNNSRQQPPSVPFTIYDTTENNQVIENNLQIPLPLRIDAVLNDFLEGLDPNGNPEPDGPYEFISNLLVRGPAVIPVGLPAWARPQISPQDFSTGVSTQLGASLITATATVSSTPTPLYDNYSAWFNSLTGVLITQALDIIAGYRRDFYDIHRNIPVNSIHNSEAIMYVVEKRVVQAGQT